MGVTLAPLGPKHLPALRAHLVKDPAHNLYLLGLLEEFGLVSESETAPFTFYARFLDDELTAAVFVGGDGGLVVPSSSLQSAMADLAKRLVGKVHLGACVGEKGLVDVLQQHLGGSAPTMSRVQRLLTVSADDLGPFTNPLLRPATDADLPQLVPMAAAAVQELMGRDPLVEDADGFAGRVQQRVRAQRTYVLEEHGRLVFKLDVGPRSQFGAELEGIYTAPSDRGKGHATLCLGQISRFLLSSLPRLAVRVDEDAPHFAGVARKVGYLAVRPQRLVVNGDGRPHARP